MKKIIILSLFLAATALHAQPQPSDTLSPCGRYRVTNGAAIAETECESAILKSLRSGDANITSEVDNPSEQPPAIDTATFLEIIAGEVLSLLSTDEVNSVYGVPQSVVLTPQLLTVAHEGSTEPSCYPLVGITPDGDGGHGWTLLRADAPAIGLCVDGCGIYTLKMPGQKTLRLRRE